MSYPNKILTGLALCLALLQSATGEIKPGQAFPDLSQYGLDGRPPEIAGRVVLVDFWASWCGPCKASFPAYSKLQHELAERGFVLVAVSVDKSAAPYDDFLHHFRPEFGTLRDGSQKLVAEVKVPAMPTSYLIDRKGIVRSIHVGFHGESTIRQIREEALRLLEE